MCVWAGGACLSFGPSCPLLLFWNVFTNPGLYSLCPSFFPPSIHTFAHFLPLLAGPCHPGWLNSKTTSFRKSSPLLPPNVISFPTQQTLAEDMLLCNSGHRHAWDPVPALTVYPQTSDFASLCLSFVAYKVELIVHRVVRKMPYRKASTQCPAQSRCLTNS